MPAGPAPHDARGVAALEQECRSSLTLSIEETHPDWVDISLTVRTVGYTTEMVLVVTDSRGVSQRIKCPRDARTALQETRTCLTDREHGAWLSCRVHLTRDVEGRIEHDTDYNFDDDPEMSLTNPQGALTEIELNPRSHKHVQPWLDDLLERAVAEQVAAGEKPSTAVPWLTGGSTPGAHRPGRLARWGRSVADKVSGRPGATDGPSSGASSSAPSTGAATAAAADQSRDAGGLVGAGTGAGTSTGAADVPMAEVAALVPEDLRRAWLATAAPSVALHQVDAAAGGGVGHVVVVVGGDTVDLPAGSSWPAWRDRPFQLHAVLDCDAARALQPSLSLPAGRVALFTPPAGVPTTDGPAGTAVIHLPPGTPTTTVHSPDGVPLLPRVLLAGTAQDSYDTLDLLALDLHTTDPHHPALAGLTGMAALTGTDDGDEDDEPFDDEDGPGEGGVITDADELFETVSDTFPPPDLAGRIGGWPDPTGTRPHHDLADADPTTTPPWTLLLQLNTPDPGTDDVHYWLTPDTRKTGSGDDGVLAVHHLTQH